MKTTTFLTSAVVLVSFLGSTSAFAVEYEDAKAITDAQVEFEKSTGPIDPVDPENPEGITPELPTNPNVGDFGILYASDFNFGKHENVGSDVSANVLAVEDTKGNKILPNIQTVDLRGSDRKGWVLTAKVNGAFTDKDKNELKGAELVFSKLAYKGTAPDAPTAKSGEITLSSTAQELASANNENGAGVWALAFGSLDSNREMADGATLNVPKNTVVNATTYSTTITYELVADPASAK